MVINNAASCAATRLLDFTYTPLIAAFFAIADINHELSEKCVWAFPYTTINDINSKLLNNQQNAEYADLSNFYQKFEVGKQKDIDIIGIYDLNHPSIRPYNQRSSFLFSMSENKDFQQMLRQYFNDERSPLLKLSVNIELRPFLAVAIEDFQSMNINYSSLFPGLDGYSKDILLHQYIMNSIYSMFKLI